MCNASGQSPSIFHLLQFVNLGNENNDQISGSMSENCSNNYIDLCIFFFEKGFAVVFDTLYLVLYPYIIYLLNVESFSLKSSISKLPQQSKRSFDLKNMEEGYE